MGKERLGPHKAGQARAFHPVAITVPEIQGRQAEHIHRLQQLDIGRRTLGDIGLEQDKATELFCHSRIMEGVLLELLAGHAPVGVEIQHHWQLQSLGFLQSQSQIIDIADTLEFHFDFLLCGDVGSRSCQQWV